MRKSILVFFFVISSHPVASLRLNQDHKPKKHKAFTGLGFNQQACKCIQKADETVSSGRKDAIVLLAKNQKQAQEGTWKRGESLFDFNHTLMLLYRNFNNCYRKDVLVFHNGDFEDEDQQYFKNLYDARLQFHTLEKGGPYWQLPPAAGLKESDLHSWVEGDRFSMGYHHMMRWYGILIYQYLDNLGYDWYMRLDDDSKLLSCIEYDLFQHMRDNGWKYGFRQLVKDSRQVTGGIWELAHQYLDENSIPKLEIFMKRQDHNSKWDNIAPYNNFLISKVSFWMSPDVQKWLKHVDASGLQFTHRVSDLPVQAITLLMFMPPKQVHHFKDFAYSHFTLGNKNQCLFGALNWKATTSQERHKKLVPEGLVPKGAIFLGEQDGEVIHGCPLSKQRGCGIGFFDWP